jgi:hypothetical protein
VAYANWLIGENHGLSWKRHLMSTFFRLSLTCKVVELEKLPYTYSIGNRVSIFLVVKKHSNDYQVAYDCNQRSEAVSWAENKR